MGEEIEFLKPDGLKAAGKILKLSGNTYNVKDKFTGKSYTYKYIGETEVKTFNQVMTEGRYPKKLVKMAMGIVWDKRYVGGNMTGAVQAIEKIKKGLSDDPDVRNALRLAKKRTILVKKVLKLKEKKNQIVDQKRIKLILKNIKKKSLKNKIDPKITHRIWQNMILAYIDFERRNFKKK